MNKIPDSREQVLARIRAAARGQAGGAQQAASAPGACRPQAQWQPVVRFRERALALASTVDEAAASAEAPARVAAYLKEQGLPLRGVCWPELAGLPWEAAGMAVEARPARGDDLVGITGAFCAIAETGTLVLASGAATPASVSLLPETHVALLRASRIVRDLEEAWGLLRAELGALPRAVNLVSGPSRTADIEQTINLGAHGPYRVHILLL